MKLNGCEIKKFLSHKHLGYTEKHKGIFKYV
jgi:hypothetical protein